MRTLLPCVLFLPLLLSLFLLGPCGAVAGEEPAEKSAEVTWDRLHVSGAHAGYVHTVVRTVGKDGEKRVETSSVTDMTMKRMGQSTHIHSRSTTLEKPDGTLLRIESEMKMSAQVSKTTFTFEGARLTIETSVMGNTRKVERAVDEDLVGPRHGTVALEKLAGTTGEEVRVKTYMADFQKIVTTVNTSKGMEKTALHDGREVELTRVESVLEGIPAMKPVLWLDAEGRVVKTSLTMTGIQFDTFRVATEALAKGEGEKAAETPDVFNQTLIREDDPIPVPRHLEQAVVHLTRRDETLAFPKVEARGWEASTAPDGGLIVKARRTVPAEGKLGVRPLADVPAELKDALAASSMIQSDAEAIVKTAREAVGEEKSAWKAAQKLERWVFENMTQKDMSVGFASAQEALETRQGDCTEHAVLLAALCRAAGIPARVVMGIEYLYGIWGGHAWNDVWIDGGWYQLDATNGYGFVDPLHIPMAQMVMKEGGQSEFIEIMGSLGNLDVDIRSVVRAGREIAVSDSARLVTTEDRRYCNRIWGIRFDAPEGYAFDPPDKRKGMSPKLMELDGKTAAGKTVEIRIDALDAPPRGGVDALLVTMRVDPASVRSGTLDGRPARTVTRTGGGRQVTRTVVVANDALYIFTLDRAGEEAERKAFEAFLESVDFDVK